jgi:hypothetical protein
MLLSFSVAAKEIPKFLTKHPIDALRYITSDGRYAYLKKKQGVLGMVSSFRSVDFISDAGQSDFLVKDSHFKQRLVIEILPGLHHEFNLMKNHKIMTVDWGKSQPRDIGMGQSARLHLDDEWISYYDIIERHILVQNILTQKRYTIKLSPRLNPFFIPEVEMVSSDTVVYTDVNEKGFTSLVQYNLTAQKANIMYKSPQSGTKLELCQNKGYLAIGEFPYDDLQRSSTISRIKISGSTNLAGMETLYTSADSDVGNLLCQETALYFIKTMNHDRKLNVKITEAVKLDLKSTQVQTMTEMSNVSQLISMDGRVLIPFRGDYYVLEGTANLTDDTLKNPGGNADPVEELPLEI